MLEYAKSKIVALRRIRQQDVQIVLRKVREKLSAAATRASQFANDAWGAACGFSRVAWHARLLTTFLLLVLLWVVVWLVPRSMLDGGVWRHVSRVSGYLALIAMAIPYVHVTCRAFRRRPLAHASSWLRWHIITAYAAFFFALVHSQAHAQVGLTLWLLLALWAVMFSGVGGYFGQKMCYRLLALSVRREVGLERIEFERDRLIARAEEITVDSAWLRIEDVRDWIGLLGCPHVVAKLGKLVQPVARDALATGTVTAELKDSVLEQLNGSLKNKACWVAKDHAGAVAAKVQQLKSASEATVAEIEHANRLILEMLCPNAVASRQKPAETLLKFRIIVEQYLTTEFPTWSWLFSPAALEPVSRNHYLRARELTVPDQRESIDRLWRLADRRRQLDIEYWFHRLAHAWVLAHGPAAVFMLVPLVMHVGGACWSGGWLP